jgi:response regulator of citrate/malate metabolism
MRQGAKAYLVKPMTKNKLLANIEKYINKGDADG